MKSKIKYPRFKLALRYKGGDWHYHQNAIKKRISYKLNRGIEATRGYFIVIYGEGDLKNTSLTYELPKQLEEMKKDWVTFTDEKELEFMMNEVVGLEHG